ncbi:MAG TPA: ATP-binding cassette domain-containing protein [Burkholderiales bacterium]|nr:ATP-binding cassette domain-containing protein [Burkholderiales bacterium]
MARALLENVGKRYGDVVALEGFSLDVADGELVTVLGPSGCGKSTLLRLIAGLEPMTDGAIRLDERRIDGLPPEDRDVAMVFQSYALYPHMTVRGNVEFPLRMRRVARAERRRRAQEVAELLEIGAMLDRRPSALSGGQRQRVALARALVRHPALFLLDEPLSNLDARLRASVRQYIRDVQRRLSVTTLYVTHDQTEAMTLGHRVVVLDRGRMQQVDTPLAVYERPANAFVAGFLGAPPMNLVPGEVAGGVLAVGDQRVDLRRAWRAGASASARLAPACDPSALSGRVLVGVRPEHFAPATAEGSDQDGLSARPDPATCELLGAETLVRAALGVESVLVRLLGGGPDIPLRVSAPASALHLFEADGGRRIGP